MSYFGDPEWYNTFVYPFKNAFVQPEKAQVHLAETSTELQEQLANLRAQRLEKKNAREQREQREFEQSMTNHSSIPSSFPPSNDVNDQKRLV